MEYLGIIGAIVAVLGTLSGIYIGWSAKTRQSKQDCKAETASDVTLRMDMDYIKRGVDDIRIEQRATRQDIGALSERVTRVEEHTKQAHKRIDEIGGHR